MNNSSPPTRSLLGAMWPLLCIISLRSLLTGLSLATIPLFITQQLHLNAAAVGLTAGAQFLTAILLRLKAGLLSDQKGSAYTVTLGIQWTAVGGLLCLASYALIDHPAWALAVLLLGRIILGGSESFMMSGIQTWALDVGGNGNTGRAVGWVGTALFAALALGAPVGSILYQITGFLSTGILFIVTALPLYLITKRLPAPRPRPSSGTPLKHIVKQIRLEALCNMLGAFPYGAVISFSVLLAIDRDWQPAWALLTGFSLGLIAARLVFGGMPDRFGGRIAGIITLLVSSGGMAVMALPGPIGLGLIGAILSGAGYAILYPALAQLTIARIDRSQQGTGMAVITASNYVTLGIFSPILGLLADEFGAHWVFAIASATAMAGAILLWSARR